ncbi:MAG: (2Fe-2S) ferredoxin domain-containing protein [Bacteroidales bacterium]
MTKVKSLADLRNMKQGLNLREESKNTEHLVQIRVAMATCGIASGAKTVMEYFMDELEKRNIEAIVSQTGCMGYCYAEPTVEVSLPMQDPVVFGFVNDKKANEIIEKYIKNNELVDGIIPVNYETIQKNN